MAARRLNPRRARIHRSYTVGEVALLYGVHRNTVRGWLHSGLEKLGSGKPILIHGAILRRFLEGRRASRKRPCGSGRLYCLPCRTPRRPAGQIADYIPVGPHVGDLCALCEECGGVMHRRIRKDRLVELFPETDVRIRQAEPRL